MSCLSVQDRQYVIDRLDQDHIDLIAKAVRFVLSCNGAAEACYQPGDGTWYSLVFAPLELVGAAGGGTAGSEPSHYRGAGVLVLLQQDGDSFVVSPERHGDPLDAWTWMVESNIDTTPASVLAIAVLLEKVFA